MHQQSPVWCVSYPRWWLHSACAAECIWAGGGVRCDPRCGRGGWSGSASSLMTGWGGPVSSGCGHASGVSSAASDTHTHRFRYALTIWKCYLENVWDHFWKEQMVISGDTQPYFQSFYLIPLSHEHKLITSFINSFKSVSLNLCGLQLHLHRSGFNWSC